MPAKRLKLEDVTFTVIPEEADESPRASYGGSKNDPGRTKFILAVEEMIEDYDLWGWCDVTVRGRFLDLEAETYLCGCSYKSEEDFKTPGGYYQQMCEEVIRELQRQVEDLYEAIHEPS